MLLAALALTALAQEATDQPLAIPADMPQPREEGPWRGPRMNADAAARYEAEKLIVRTVAEFHTGPTVVSHYGWGWGGVSVAGPAVVTAVEDWAVYKGPVRLDVPTYLGTIGDTAGQTALLHRIEKNQKLARTFLGVGIAGGVAGIAGLIGANNARTVQDYATWSQVAGVGAVAFVGGMVAAPFPARKSRDLSWKPSETLALENVQEAVLGHNRDLRRRLGGPGAEDAPE